jgi:hypothetical protein
MTENRPRSRVQFGCLAVLLLVPACGVTCVVLYNREIANFEAGKQRWARESLAQDIAEIRSGQRSPAFLWIDTEMGPAPMDAFIEAKDDFLPSDQFQLSIEYSKGVDDFLRRIAGTRGIRSLHCGKSDVTDAGMVYVATFPDLVGLSIGEGPGLSDAGLAALKECPQLESLFLDRQGASFTIPAVLGLPHLRELTLHDNSEGRRWLAGVLPDLEGAHQLGKLTLAADGLPAKVIEHLKLALADCKIIVEPAGAYGH